MDPIQININVSLELGDKTVSILQQLLAAAPKPAQRKPAAKPETKPAPIPETKEDPKPEEKPEEAAPAAVEAPEAPEAPEETKEISDEELRDIVYTVRKAKPGNPQEIKNVIFPEFGIKTSIECPMERRAELVARLKQLAA